MKPGSMLNKKGEEVSANLWMVPYADLMTNMMILFLALYVFAIAKSAQLEQAMSAMQQELATDAQQESSKLRLKESELAVKLDQTLKGLALAEFGIRVTSRYVHISLPTPVLFSKGGYRLSPEARRVMSPLAEILSQVDNPVLVAGHTDDLPIRGGRYKTNFELSAARAFSVVDFFVRKGLPSSRFHVRGYGEHRPVAENSSEANRGRNRRIEIRLLRQGGRAP